MKITPYWPNDTTYFLTGTCFLHYPYFKEDAQKQILLNQIKKVEEELHIPISAYSITINHYHIKFYLDKGIELAKVRQVIHGGTSFQYRKTNKMAHKEMWQGSKALRITDEEMDWKVTGYIIGNLLKHKEVNTFEELNENRFSSYKDTVEEFGEEMARDLVYSVIDLEEDVEKGLDLEGLKGAKAPKPSAKAG